MATAIGDLVIRLGAQTSQFSKRMGGAQRTLRMLSGAATRTIAKMGALSAALIGVGSVAGIGFAIKRQLELVDAVSKTASKLGITTRALSQFHHAAQLSGVEVRTFDMALQRMLRRLAEAGQGTGEAKGALKELGIDAVTLAARRPSEALHTIADALDRVKNPTDRLRLAFKLFDSEGVAMVNVLRGGSEQLRKYAEDADRLGATIGDDTVAGVVAARDAMLRFEQSTSAVFRQAAIQLAPFIKLLADDLTNAAVNASDSIQNMEGSTSAAAQEFGVLGAGILSVADALQELQRNWVATEVVFIEHRQWMHRVMPMTAGLTSSYDSLEEATKGLAAEHKRLMEQLADLEGAPDWSTTLADRIREVKKEFEQKAGPLGIGAAGGDGASLFVAREAGKPQEQIAKLRDEFARLTTGISESQQALQKLKETGGATLVEAAQIGKLQKQIAKLKEQAGLDKIGEALKERLMTPVEQARKEAARIKELFRTGAIGAMTRGRALQEQIDKLQGEGPSAAVVPGGPAALEKESAGAMSAVLTAMRDRQKPTERHAKDTAKATAETVQLLQELIDQGEGSEFQEIPA